MMKHVTHKLSDDISVIIPVYNVEPFIHRCLNSVDSQTLQPREIILVDDGSTDASGNMCDTYAATNALCRVLHKSNGGLSDARNAGLDVAVGKWIFFIDSDDYISPYCFESLLNIATKTDADIVECGVKTLNDDEEANWEIPTLRYDVYDGHDALLKFLDYDGIRIVAWNKLYRRTLFESIRFPVGRRNEDEFTTPYLVESAKRYVTLSDQLYAYVQRAGSIMHQSFSADFFDAIDALIERYSYFSEKYDGEYDSVNAYHLLAKCRMFEKEYADELTNSQREALLTATRLAFDNSVFNTPSLKRGISFFLMKYLPDTALKLRSKS